MTNTGVNETASLIADLNDLLQLDHDAVQAYTVAIDMARDDQISTSLRLYREDHKRHIQELTQLIRERGGVPIEGPHPTGLLKLAVQSLGGIAGDNALLLAFKAVEGQGRDKYQQYGRNSYPPAVLDVISRGAADEQKHYDWVEKTLTERGVGEGTLSHDLAAALETAHRMVAEPLEQAGRQVMQTFNNISNRGGSSSGDQPRRTDLP